MVYGIFQRITSIGIWGSVCFVFSVFTASGALIFSGMLLAAVALLSAILLGPQLISAIWLVGSPTFFGFANEILRPLPFVTMERLMLLILAGMVFLRVAFTKKYTAFSFLEVLIIIFLTYALLNLAMHTSPETLSQDGWLFIQYALPMISLVISRRIEWSEKGIKIFLACLCVTGVFLAIVGILQSLFNITIFKMNYQTITSGHDGRAYGTFTSAHTYIATLFIFLTIALFQFNIYRDALIRFFLIAAMFIMIIGIVLGQTRAPWLGAAIALLIIFLYDKNIRPLMLIGGLVALVAGIAIIFIKIDELAVFISRVADLGTMTGRLATWATALNMLADHPLFGVGFGANSYIMHKAEYMTGVGNISAQYADHHSVPHNEYLHVAVLLGIPGIILFLTILFQLVKLLFGIHRNPEYSDMDRRLALYIGAIVLGLMFNSLFSDTYIQDYFWLLAYFLAGQVAGRINEKESQNNEMYMHKKGA